MTEEQKTELEEASRKLREALRDEEERLKEMIREAEDAPELTFLLDCGLSCLAITDEGTTAYINKTSLEEGISIGWKIGRTKQENEIWGVELFLPIVNLKDGIICRKGEEAQIGYTEIVSQQIFSSYDRMVRFAQGLERNDEGLKRACYLVLNRYLNYYSIFPLWNIAEEAMEIMGEVDDEYLAKLWRKENNDGERI